MNKIQYHLVFAHTELTVMFVHEGEYIIITFLVYFLLNIALQYIILSDWIII